MIDVKGLTKTYGDHQVLKGINEHIHKGEKVAIIGPSGSGKSTFLRCLNLMETPTGGSIFVDGAEITDPKCDINLHRQKMGMVFQHFNLFNNMTILRNMTLAPMTLLKKSRTEAEEKALALLGSEGRCDAAVRDVMLPGMNGFSLCETIRRTDQQIGIIILSAKGQEQDKIRGLSIGADDYMTKPFSVSELLARVEALCRRVIRTKEGDSRENVPLGTLTSGEFVLDENRRVLLKAGQPIELTQVEFQIMEYFFTNPGKALSRTDILSRVWGEEYFGEEKIVDVNIRRLRMKIEEEASDPKYILTVWGLGYKWNV